MLFFLFCGGGIDPQAGFKLVKIRRVEDGAMCITS